MSETCVKNDLERRDFASNERKYSILSDVFIDLIHYNTAFVNQFVVGVLYKVSVRQLMFQQLQQRLEQCKQFLQKLLVFFFEKGILHRERFQMEGKVRKQGIDLVE